MIKVDSLIIIFVKVVGLGHVVQVKSLLFNQLNDLLGGGGVLSSSGKAAIKQGSDLPRAKRIEDDRPHTKAELIR